MSFSEKKILTAEGYSHIKDLVFQFGERNIMRFHKAQVNNHSFGYVISVHFHWRKYMKFFIEKQKITFFRGVSRKILDLEKGQG